MRARAVIGLALVASTAQAATDKGELLYGTHCIACHQREIHWREKSVVRDWSSLIAQVERWQRYGKLNWEPADVAAVARYLNALHYRLPAPENP